MTSIISPFRRLQDATAAYRATPVDDRPGKDAAWAEYEAAEVASRGYVLTPREEVERWVQAIGREYRVLCEVEAAGGDAARELERLGWYAQELAESVREVEA